MMNAKNDSNFEKKRHKKSLIIHSHLVERVCTEKITKKQHQILKKVNKLLEGVTLLQAKDLILEIEASTFEDLRDAYKSKQKVMDLFSSERIRQKWNDSHDSSNPDDDIKPLSGEAELATLAVSYLRGVSTRSVYYNQRKIEERECLSFFAAANKSLFEFMSREIFNLSSPDLDRLIENFKCSQNGMNGNTMESLANVTAAFLKGLSKNKLSDVSLENLWENLKSNPELQEYALKALCVHLKTENPFIEA